MRPFHNSIEAIVGNDIVRVAIQGDANGFDYDTDLIAVAAINSLTAMELFELLEIVFHDRHQEAATKIWRIAGPSILSNVLSACIGIVDIWAIGNLSQEA